MVSSADYLKLVFCSKALNSAGFKTLLKVLTWPQPVLSCYEAALTLQQQVWEAIQTSDHPLLTSPQLPGGFFWGGQRKSGETLGGAGRNVRGHINLGTALVIQGRWGDLGRGPKREPYRRNFQVLRQQVAPAPGELGVVVSRSPRAGPAPSLLPHWLSKHPMRNFGDCVLPPRKVVLL